MKTILITIGLIAIFSLSKAQQAGTIKQDTIYVATEVEPAFPVDMKYFYQYLAENIRYSDNALSSGKQGKVFVTFVVEKDGSLTNVKVLRGLFPDLDEEAVRVVSKSPNWQPGTQNGIPVRVQYSMAINFKLPLVTVYRTKEQTDALTNQSPEDKIYTVVEQEPAPVGGMNVFYQYLGQNIHYPESAKRKNIQGKVFLTFVVEKDGTLSNIKVLRGVWEDIDAEAVRVFKNAPKWNPGMQKGKPVRAQYNVPISFILQNN